ncbi:hypothetical protein M3Y97_00001100 [Aphelenchoides bicaudatus]|nr:hypothetical protein M3Y97_00001100 [Aphelenchoides bicaudatus]
MHSQIYPINPRKSQPNATQPYDVHMIILDSVSMSQGFRSLPMTIHFLRNEMDAVPMPYLNKVGVNSRPNGYAFLMNERASDLPKNPWGKEMKGGRSEQMCDKSLNNETFIGYDFQNNGYKTMLNEDWSMGIFTYPNCKGFSKPPVDHFLKPYMLRVEGSASYKEPGYNDILFKKICRERHHLVLNNLRNFILKYPNDPKWSLNWNTNLSHDDMNGLYHSDSDFREFFKEMAPRLKNSFIFFMGDHGGRTGKVRNSAIGEYEDNNPMMFVVLPEKLRTNRDLYNQLKENAKQIVSHYDLYATTMEIATTSVKWNDTTPFSTSTFVTNARKLKGTSFFHPLPQPRTCDSLLIPFNHCNCQHPSEAIEERELGIKIGEVIIAKINNDVKKSIHAKDCMELSLDKSFSIGLKEYEAGLHKGRRIIKIHLRAKPSDALYEGFVEVRGKEIVLVDESFPRLNMYKEQAACIPQNFFKNYCYCKNYKGGKKQ